jgi:hypothetical protein
MPRGDTIILLFLVSFVVFRFFCPSLYDISFIDIRPLSLFFPFALTYFCITCTFTIILKGVIVALKFRAFALRNSQEPVTLA